MEFFNAFGVSWKSLIAQFVNFAILMFILHRFAYKPLLKFMQDRTSAIAQGVQNAKEAKHALEQSKEQSGEVLANAHREAIAIVEQARKAAELQAVQIVAQAKEEVAAVVAQGKQALQVERRSMIEQVKKDVIDMVVSSTEKILGGVVDEKMDQSWLKSQLARVKSK